MPVTSVSGNMPVTELSPDTFRNLLNPAKVSRFSSSSCSIAIRGLVGKIVVHDKDVEVTLKTGALLGRLGLNEAGDDLPDIVIKNPINYRRLGIKDKIILGDSPARAQKDPAMIKAIVRAHYWFGLLRDHKVKSIADIAVQEGLARNYVSMILNLAFLPPELTEVVLDGRQEDNVNLDYLIRSFQKFE